MRRMRGGGLQSTVRGLLCADRHVRTNRTDGPVELTLVSYGKSSYMFFSFRLFVALSFRAKTRNPGSVSIPWIPAFAEMTRRVCTDFRHSVPRIELETGNWVFEFTLIATLSFLYLKRVNFRFSCHPEQYDGSHYCPSIPGIKYYIIALQMFIKPFLI